MSDLSIGIDLGTTNSAVSIMIGDKVRIPKIVKLSSGKTTLPSCVMWLGEDNWVVGDLAYNQRHRSNSAYSMKKYMGSQHVERLSYQGEGYELTPVKFSSLILAKLKEEVESIYGKGIVNKVTITVPAYFDDSQRKDTKKAGELAGWEVVRIINEPTSASLAYTMGELSKSETAMVFDLGGGTFDVNMIRFVKDDKKFDFPLLDLSIDDDREDRVSVNILSTDGDTKLGGDNLDDYLTDLALDKMGFCKAEFTVEQIKELTLIIEKEKKLGDWDRSRQVLWNGYNFRVNKQFWEYGFDVMWDKCKKIVNKIGRAHV